LAKPLQALVLVDNTFLSPVLQNPLALGADMVLHSTTKYLNGHSDIVGGALIIKDAVLGDELKWWANCLGVTGSAFDSHLTLRGIRTLLPRMKAHQENAALVVDYLQQQPLAGKIYYPGLASHPGHAIAKAQQHGFGAMVSFDLAADAQYLSVFFAALNCFTLAQSLGGIESLICHPGSMTHASMDAAAQQAAGIGPTLIRLSVGIEDPRDLLADLQHAFAVVQQAIDTDTASGAAKPVTPAAQPAVTHAAQPVGGQHDDEQQFRANPALCAFW
jgi:cystathionine gamma-synthase